MKKLILTLAAMVVSATAFAFNLPVVDYLGNALPASPIATFDASGKPVLISAAGITTNVYAYGSGPYPITNYGGIKRECNKLDSGHTSCYSTNPQEITLTESSICGFPVVPAVIMSCRGNACKSELFLQACTTVFPDRQASTGYVAPYSSKNIAGNLNNGSDFSDQSFSTRLDFTSNLNTARKIKALGHMPALSIGAIVFDSNGNLVPDAYSRLINAINAYPDVFYTPGIPMEVIDEPFNNIPVSQYPTQSNQINLVISWLKNLTPNASLGVTIAPIWNNNAQMLPAIETIASQLSWVATDPYLNVLENSAASLQLATDFINYMQAYHPTMNTWLIVQGFAPVFSKPPAQWGAYEINTYTNFLGQLMTIGNRYNGLMVWGWSDSAELDPQFSSANFPQVIKDLYNNYSR